MSGFMAGSRGGMVRSSALKSVFSRRRNRPQATRQPRHWACESLETRRLFATVSWITHGSGDWSVGSNWNTGTVPGPTDSVVIDVPGVNLTVTYSASPVLPLGNLLNTELLDVEGGGASWQGGTFDGSGVVVIGTTLAISGSADKIMKDGITLENLGTTTLSGTGNIVGQVGAAIINAPGATFNVKSDADITFPTGVGSGIFENGGTFIKSVGGTAPGNATEIGGAQGFEFEDSLNNLIDPTMSIPGDCQVLQGTLQLGDNQSVALTQGGTFEISANATLDFNLGAANIVVLRPPMGAPQIIPSITGAGTLEVSGAAVQFYGTLAVHEIDVSAGSLLLQQNMQEIAGGPQLNTTPNVTPLGTADILRVSGGTIGGNGGGIFPAMMVPFNVLEEPALVVGTTFQWTGGTFSGTGRIVIDITVTNSTISGTNPKAIDGDFALDLLAPETIWTGSGIIDMNGNGVLYIHNSATLWDQADGTFTQGALDTQGGRIWNLGIVLKQGGTGTTTIGPGIDFINDEVAADVVTPTIPLLQYNDPGNPSETFAKLDIRTGTVSLQGTSTNRNTYLIHPGATLSFDAGSHQNQTYTASNNAIDASILGVSGGGSINFGDVIFDSDLQSLVDVPFATFGGGNYSFNNVAPGGQRILTGVFNGGASGVISGNGTLEVVTSFLWNSGTFNGTNSGTSSLLIDSGAVATLAAGSYTTTNTYSVDNRGTLRWATSPGNLSIGGNFDQTSTGTFDSTFVNGIPDSLTVTGTVSLAGALNLNVTSLVPVNGAMYTLINNIGATAISGQFAGIPEGTVLNLGGDHLQVSYVGGTGNDMVLTAIVFPVIIIDPPNVFVRALSGVTNLDFTVMMSAPTSVAVTVHYTTTPGTAIAGVDYITTSGTLTIAAGTQTGTISVPVIGTSAIVSPRTFTVTLSNPTSANLGTPSSAVATIVSANGPPALQFQTAAYVVDENAGFATIVVTTSNPSLAASVQYATADGTAIAGVDYTATSGVLTFTAGTSQVTFNVPIIDRGLTSGQTVFTINLFNPTGNGAILGTAVTNVAILDNDGVTPSITISNTTVTEPLLGQTTAVFALTLSTSTPKAVSVQYATSSGTAQEGKYVAKSGTITFAPGQTTSEIDILINSDFIQTTTETFTVTLFNPVNVTLANSSAVGTILSQTLTTVPLSAGHAFHYLDAFGKHATISLSGPGSGTIFYLGTTQQDAKQIVLNGTTTQSILSIGTSKGQTGIENIIVNGSIRSINAAPVLLTGVVNVTGGVQNLRLNSLFAGSSVTIGSDASIATLNATLNSVVNASITSSVPLGTVRVNSWQNGLGIDGITAPSARTIRAAHDFSADVSLPGNLGSMAVGGNLSSSIIRVGGSINSLTAGTISNSDIFAGVLDNVTTLPATTSQFADSGSTIKRLTVTRRTAGAFANSLIAAPIVGNVQLGSVMLTNGGTLFGVAGASISSVRGRGYLPIKLTGTELMTSPFSTMDLVIRLT
jgi:hypothetical protein